jgi:hypothetical protein
MSSNNRRRRDPQWVRTICCLAPFVAVLTLCGATAAGQQVDVKLMASVAALGGYVVKRIV